MQQNRFLLYQSKNYRIGIVLDHLIHPTSKIYISIIMHYDKN